MRHFVFTSWLRRYAPTIQSFDTHGINLGNCLQSDLTFSIDNEALFDSEQRVSYLSRVGRWTPY
jgi:hypothetical protein